MYKTKNTMNKQARCPKCGGKLFLDKDFYGWYDQCLLCGHLRNIEKVLEVSVKTSDEVYAKPNISRR